MNLVQKQIKNFTDLEAWQVNHQLVLAIYKLTKKFPKEELFGLTSQSRRGVVSITANIAEAFGRFKPKDRIHFYHQSRGSSLEVYNHLIIAKDLRYITEGEFDEIIKILNSGARLINGLIRTTENIG